MHVSHRKSIATKVLFIAVSSLALIVSACAHPPVTTPPSTPVALPTELSSTMVPNLDLDIYLFFKQAEPTVVPKSLIGTSTDITVESLSLWGIVNEDTYAIGGALVFTSAADAAAVQSQIPDQDETWTRLSGRTVYLVQGSGGPADSLKDAINANDFKRYDDEMAIEQVALMPTGGQTIPAAILVIKPSQAMIKFIEKYTGQSPPDMQNTIISLARLQVITLGIYAPQQIDFADLEQQLEQNSFRDTDLGLVASVKSGWPGFIVDPVAGKLLDSSDFSKTTLGDLTVYNGSFENEGGTVTVLLDVASNRLWATVSGRESYARTLMTAITRD